MEEQTNGNIERLSELPDLPENMKQALKDKTLSDSYITYDIMKDNQDVTASIEVASASSDETGDSPMSDDHFNILHRDLKEDAREREQRYHDYLKEQKELFSKQLDDYKSDSKEKEERFQKTADNIYAVIKEMNNNFHVELKDLKSEIKDDLKTQKEDYQSSRERIDEAVKHLESMKRTTFWGQIAFLVGVATIIVTFILNI